MTKLYLIIAICVTVVGAYFFGINIGNAKCQLKLSRQIQQTQTQDIRNKRVINDKVYKTGVSDIRRILFDKYTIAE